MRGLLWSLPRSPRLLPCRLAIRWPRELSRSLVSAADLHFGQPLHETHPHLLQPGELTPGISALEYAQRRAKLAAALPPNSVAILAAAEVKPRSGTVFYRFHQDPNFLYLTGFNEPEALAVIEKDGEGSSHNFHLYCRPKDPHKEKWEGTRSGIQAAQDVFNADEAGDVGQSLTALSKIITTGRTVYTDLVTEAKAKSTFTKIIFGSSTSAADSISELLQRASVRSLRQHIHDLRITKSDAEIAMMRKAGKASGKAFTEAMSQQFTTEAQVDAFLDYKFKSLGCDESAYVPVIGGGENALQIHYVRNDDVLRDGEMVTVDAGGEIGSYVTDITRAWPVNGRFSDAQRDLYQMILEVQKSFTEVGLKDGLRALGFSLVPGSLDLLYPHHVGHYLGLAVHDLPGYTRGVKLKENQVVTVEPGIYVDADPRWPKHFHNTGIRIEDSVCVGKTSPYVLTTEAVKEIRDIEACRS